VTSQPSSQIIYVQLLHLCLRSYGTLQTWLITKMLVTSETPAYRPYYERSARCLGRSASC
jgi:hypothetical protein